MGTNVYAVKRMTDEDKKTFKSFIDSEDLYRMKEYLENNFHEIHIGKRSGGWKFLFNHNNYSYYDPRDESNVEKFISNPLYKLYNEYGEKITPEEFWKEYVDDCSNGLTLKEYYEKNPDMKKYHDDSADSEIIIKGKHNYRISNYTDFC